MIRYWQQEDGKIVEKKEANLNPGSETWVDARSVTQADMAELEQKYGIDGEHLLDILDPDELSRIEYNADAGYTLAIVRLPVFSPEDEISYFCAPLGIVIKDKLFITVCWTDCEVLRDFSANRISELNLGDFPAVTIRFLARSDVMFLRYLKELNRRATTIQNEMLNSVQNYEFIQLLNIQKSLLYFETSLKSNQMLLEKLRKTNLLKLDQEDQDWLDDVEIDNRQAMEMVDTYSNIMVSMNDAFSSVLGNNLNIVMKTMTGWNLVLVLPTLVTSYFGINVPLPWQNSPWFGAVIVLAMCGFAGTLAYLFFMKRRLTPDVKKKLSRAAIREERRKRRLAKKR